FFFSSRRRHTRWPRDWSSDVCSSDLGEAEVAGRIAHLGELGAWKMLGDFGILREQLEQRLAGGGDFAADVVDEVVGALASEMREIGRASCREREWSRGSGGGW